MSARLGCKPDPDGILVSSGHTADSVHFEVVASQPRPMLWKSRSTMESTR